jgi:glucose/arabinose dehydrogenase
MRRRTAALIAASVVSAGAVAGTATAAGGPPAPKGVHGAKVQLFAAGGGLATPTSFAFGGGNVFEGDGGAEQSGPPNGGVFLLKNGTGTKLPGSPSFVAGLAWRKGTLYISAATFSATGPKFQILAWSGWNGITFTKQKAIYTAPKKFDGFNGLAFGPDGRIYVGVDVGFTDNNDHGPGTKSLYVYDILSMDTHGKHLKVFATGIRQPWQFAFARGSKAPFVSDLGQDSGAKNPPDFVLKVRKGDNYGFPQCNWKPKSKCKGFTKPFKFFAPHTDIMGLAIIGNKLYMTSFLGTTGHGGEVLSMPLKGGKVTPVVTGFVAPTVGLGQHNGSLYVGEAGPGLVYKIKP